MYQSLHKRKAVRTMIRATAVPGKHVLKGIPASPGIAIGRAVILTIEKPTAHHEHVSAELIESEVERFTSALDVATSELMAAVELARAESDTVTTIIESYLQIVGDPVITASIGNKIRDGYSAESAVIAEYDAHRSMLFAAQSAFMRERAQDIENVKDRLLASLRNKHLSHASARDSIVVAGSVTPQDMLFFKQKKSLAFVTEVGGINSHASILARDVGIPAVVGIRNATSDIANGATLIVDGYSGILIVDPDEATLAEYTEKLLRAEEYRQRLGELRDKESATTDGTHITLTANVDTPDDVDTAVMQGCEGIGLVRTEFLLMQLGRYPTLDEQVAWYRDIAERAFPHPVTFRAFDVGSDKFREGIPHHEYNPALGLRGIRFLLYRTDIFAQQVCAVLRASANRNVRFMLPMLTVAEELDQAHDIIDECKRTLVAEGIEFDANMPVGVMIETPAAALMADVFARNADFLSIGTNDLAQYALATDRTNEMVADIYDEFHPAVLRLIHMVVVAGNNYDRGVSICGELAGHAASTEMLIGLGIRELSVTPRLVLEVKQRIRVTTIDVCDSIAQRSLQCISIPDVYAVLAEGR